MHRSVKLSAQGGIDYVAANACISLTEESFPSEQRNASGQYHSAVPWYCQYHFSVGIRTLLASDPTKFGYVVSTQMSRA
jgi:hypothetical protein